MLRPLVERGHEVRWLLSRETEDRKPYDLHGVTVYPRRDHAQTLTMVKEADVVIAHLENTPTAVVLSRLHKKPFVLIMHNGHELSLAWNVADAAAIVVNSEWMNEDFGKPANGLIIRPPVFAEEYRTKPGGKIALINLNEAKGGEVFAELAARMPDVDFLAVKGAYGEQIIPDLPNVEVREHGGDMLAVYADTRVLLMPSSYESWGRVGVEAMCSGIPVIAHPTPGLVESLGPAGIFANRSDPDAWEAAIRNLLKPAAWKAASRRAIKRATELDPAEDIARWVSAIERLTPRAR